MPSLETNPSEQHDTAGASHAGTAALSLGALGVVYGDIGTSPLYALREAVRAASGDGIQRPGQQARDHQQQGIGDHGWLPLAGETARPEK